jgi:hypothetical protein
MLRSDGHCIRRSAWHPANRGMGTAPPEVSLHARATTSATTEDRLSAARLPRPPRRSIATASGLSDLRARLKERQMAVGTSNPFLVDFQFTLTELTQTYIPTHQQPHQPQQQQRRTTQTCARVITPHASSPTRGSRKKKMRACVSPIAIVFILPLSCDSMR